MELQTCGDVTLPGAIVAESVQRKRQLREGQFFFRACTCSVFRWVRNPPRELRPGVSDVGEVIACHR